MSAKPAAFLLALLLICAAGCLRETNIPENSASANTSESDAQKTYTPVTQADRERADKIARLEEKIQKSPNDPGIYLELGQTYIAPTSFARTKAEGDNDRKAAFRMFEKSLELDPKNTQAMIAYASIFSESGSREDLLKSNDIFSKILEARPENLQIYFQMARNWEKLGDDSKSLALMNRVDVLIHQSTVIDEELLSYSRDLGEYYKNLEQYPKAISILEWASAKADSAGFSLKYSQILAELGRVYTKSGNYIAAENTLKKAAQTMDGAGIEQGSYWGCLYHAIGTLYMQMKRNTEACDAYAKSADEEKLNYNTNFSASLACHLAGNQTLAVKYLERSIDLAKKNSLSLQERPLQILKGFILVAENRITEARGIFEKMKASYPGNAGSNVGLGRIHLAESRLETAREDFLKGVDVLDSSQISNIKSFQELYNAFLMETALLGLGNISALEKDFDQALDYFQRIDEFNPESQAALLAKANALGHLKRYDEAKTAVNKVLETDPENARAFSELALINFNTGDLDAAEKYFKKAKAAGQENYTCPYEGLGLVYFKQGRLDEAKANLQKAIEINPDVEYKKFNALAKIYLREGNTKKAVELLEKSMANNPHDDEAARMLSKIRK